MMQKNKPFSIARRGLLLGIAFALSPGTPAAAEVPNVGAAASLRFALDEIADAYVKAGGTRPRISYAASGSLVQQIRQGAPYGLFLSADESHVAVVEKAGLTAGKGTVFAVGRVAMAVPPGSKLNPTLADLSAALGKGQIRRLSIANPKTAPYGVRAVEVLKASGLWGKAQTRLVIGDNVGQAFQFVASGGADAGLLSYSLVVSPGFRGRYALVPAGLHAPLNQKMVLLKGAGTETRRFHSWLLGAGAAAVFARYGYQKP